MRETDPPEASLPPLNIEAGEYRVAAFDTMAAAYDATFTDSMIGRALRDIVWSRLAQVFRPSQRILELGCGSGEDAAWLASRGVRVVAVDSSSQMIGVARRKAARRHLEQLIEFRCSCMEATDCFADGDMFDGVLSNFGAINCAKELPPLVAAIAAHLRPGAVLVWVVMGRHAPWEWCWHLARGSWRKAWRRLNPDGSEWRGLTITYPTPNEMRSALRPYFSVTRLAPLGLALPPTYAAAWLDRLPFFARLLTALERWAQRSSMLAACSDHFIIEAVRRSNDARAVTAE